MKIKGLKSAVQYAKACPSGHYVEWFARPIKGGWEVDTTGYMSINSWLANYDAWNGWFYLNETMHIVRERYEYDNKKPSLSTVIRLACNVLESKVIR